MNDCIVYKIWLLHKVHFLCLGLGFADTVPEEISRNTSAELIPLVRFLVMLRKYCTGHSMKAETYYIPLCFRNVNWNWTPVRHDCNFFMEKHYCYNKTYISSKAMSIFTSFSLSASPSFRVSVLWSMLVYDWLLILGDFPWNFILGILLWKFIEEICILLKWVKNNWYFTRRPK